LQGVRVSKKGLNRVCKGVRVKGESRIFHEIEPHIIHLFIVETHMDNFDINAVKAEIAEAKRVYDSILADKTQLAPERCINALQFYINLRSAEVAKYEALQQMIHNVDQDKEELMDDIRRVRAKLE
jgi:hypothetical protein